MKKVITIFFTLVASISIIAQNFGNALEFNGSTDYVHVPHSKSLDINEFTLTAWVYPYSYSGPLPDETRMEILEKCDVYWMNISTTSSTQNRHIGQLRVGAFTGSKPTWRYLDSKTIIPLNKWTHVACTFDLDSLRIFINGNYDVGMKIPDNFTTVNDLDMGIGCKYNEENMPEAQFNGMLDEITIWDTALVAENIKEIMAPISIDYKFWDHLVSYYQFNEDNIGKTDTIVYDTKRNNNGIDFGAVWKANAGIATLAQIEKPSYQNLELYQNYPNPFNPTTLIQFNLPHSGLVTIKIYDVLGREIYTLLEKELNSGKHIVKFDGSGLNSGVYIYRIATNGYQISKKMLLVK